ncbi:MAG: hypothetical protein DHS20C14_14380 [Phycisphaeraceae bacterium]|nr:MAG: hypothetical protein DHS20C14_14380 [Phycisphaeraceae bacterium]
MTRSSTAARACLFGGAIFAAGISASDAGAQTFAMQYHYHRVVTQGANPISLLPYGSGPFGVGNTVSIRGDFSAHVTTNNKELSFSHDRSGTGTFSYSTVEAVSYFVAVENLIVRAEWDVGGWATGIITLDDLTAGTRLIDVSGSPPGGQTVSLPAGHQFLAVLYTRGSAAGGPSWGSLTLLEPCVADFDRNGVLNVDDIGAFVDSFLGGCP